MSSNYPPGVSDRDFDHQDEANIDGIRLFIADMLDKLGATEADGPDVLWYEDDISATFSKPHAKRVNDAFARLWEAAEALHKVFEAAVQDREAEPDYDMGREDSE